MTDGRTDGQTDGHRTTAERRAGKSEASSFKLGDFTAEKKDTIAIKVKKE